MGHASLIHAKRSVQACRLLLFLCSNIGEESSNRIRLSKKPVRRMVQMIHIDRCALTGKPGKFVKCHILPQAFTKPAIKGEPLHQSTRGKGERRRWSSWYDKNLVTREGEDILSAIDDKAIKQLRKHQLVWSSWAGFRPHMETFAPVMPDHGYRKISVVESEALIRFALSIAWRASASSLPDMEHATLEPEIQDRLKDYVLGAKIEGASAFPVSLIQLSTCGETHNHSPYVDEKKFVDPDNDDHEPLKIMRLYMDGLISHVHLSPIPIEHIDGNPLYLGTSDHAFVTTVTYEASFQYENLMNIALECFT